MLKNPLDSQSVNRQARQPEAHQNYHEVIYDLPWAGSFTWKEVVASRLCVMPLAGVLGQNSISSVLASCLPASRRPITFIAARRPRCGEALIHCHDARRAGGAVNVFPQPVSSTNSDWCEIKNPALESGVSMFSH